jgi:hypothetical protein
MNKVLMKLERTIRKEDNKLLEIMNSELRVKDMEGARGYKVDGIERVKDTEGARDYKVDGIEKVKDMEELRIQKADEIDEQSTQQRLVSFSISYEEECMNVLKKIIPKFETKYIYKKIITKMNRDWKPTTPELTGHNDDIRTVPYFPLPSLLLRSLSLLVHDYLHAAFFSLWLLFLDKALLDSVQETRKSVNTNAMERNSNTKKLSSSIREAGPSNEIHIGN